MEEWKFPPPAVPRPLPAKSCRKCPVLPPRHSGFCGPLRRTSCTNIFGICQNMLFQLAQLADKLFLDFRGHLGHRRGCNRGNCRRHAMMAIAGIETIFSLPLVDLTDGAIRSFSIFLLPQTGQSRWFPVFKRANSSLEANQPSNSWSL